MKLEFEDIIRQKAPGLVVGLLEANIENPPTPDALWEQIRTVEQRIRDSYAMDMVNKHPAIAATRTAYKAMGKEPNRYRPSAEALMRRAVKGLELYRLTAMVDLINLASMMTGHSIGAFDTDCIDGDTLTLGVGRQGEPYAAIGRGELNIAGLPVWRDKTGGVGTPTSDNERTKITPATRHVTVTVNMYSGAGDAQDTMDVISELMTRYCAATDIKVSYHQP